MEAEILKELADRLNEIVRRLKEELQGVRGNRPSVQLLEDIRVDYYGQTLSVKQLASLAIRPPRDIEINVWDKGAVGAVVKAIEGAKAGFSVFSEGNAVRVSLPPLTSERRAELEKLVGKMAENSRIAVRKERDETIKKLKAAEEDKKISEDQVFRAKEEVQKLVAKANKDIEALWNGKLKELSQ
jgi:ribosome recycling factor